MSGPFKYVISMACLSLEVFIEACLIDPRPAGDRVLPEASVLLRQHHR